MRHLILLFFVFFGISCYASHTHGGYINYTHLAGNTYEITVHLFQDLNSPAIQRQEIEINFGDNSGADTIFKTAQLPLNNSTFNIAEMVYTTQHTYAGFGRYTISVEDPNRPDNIINFASSINTPVYLRTSLEISPSVNLKNNSPVINSNIVFYSQSGKDLRFNLSAFDSDGDFLTYKLVRPRGTNGVAVSGYSFPSGVSVDQINGEFKWDNPPVNLGFHQFTVEITECRNDRFIATTSIDFMIYNSASNHTSRFISTDTLNRNETGNISYTIQPGDSLELNINYESTDTFTLRLMDGTQRASYNSNGDFKFISRPEDNRCAPYLFIFEADSRAVLEHQTVMIHVIDSNLINCDTICGFNSLSIENRDLTRIRELNIHPNPFTNQTTINLPTNFRVHDFNLFNRLGQRIQVETNITNSKIKISGTNLQAGIYFYRIEGSNRQVYSGKLVAQ